MPVNSYFHSYMPEIWLRVCACPDHAPLQQRRRKKAFNFGAIINENRIISLALRLHCARASQLTVLYLHMTCLRLRGVSFRIAAGHAISVTPSRRLKWSDSSRTSFVKKLIHFRFRVEFIQFAANRFSVRRELRSAFHSFRCNNCQHW